MKFSIISSFVFAFALFAGAGAQAAVSSTGTITKVAQYSSFGQGDALIYMSSTHPSCNFYWIKATDGGAQATLSVALSFFLAGQSVKIYADETDSWSGSGASTCRIDSIFSN